MKCCTYILGVHLGDKKQRGVTWHWFPQGISKLSRLQKPVHQNWGWEFLVASHNVVIVEEYFWRLLINEVLMLGATSPDLVSLWETLWQLEQCFCVPTGVVHQKTQLWIFVENLRFYVIYLSKRSCLHEIWGGSCEGCLQDCRGILNVSSLTQGEMEEWDQFQYCICCQVRAFSYSILFCSFCCSLLWILVVC